jgi:hypothetical protein
MWGVGTVLGTVRYRFGLEKPVNTHDRASETIIGQNVGPVCNNLNVLCLRIAA